MLLLEIAFLLVIVFLCFFEGVVHGFGEYCHIFLRLPNTILQLPKILPHNIIQLLIIFLDILTTIFKRQNPMRPMPIISIGTINTQNFSLSQAVQSKSIIMLHTSKGHIIAVHEIVQIDCCEETCHFLVELFLFGG